MEGCTLVNTDVFVGNGVDGDKGKKGGKNKFRIKKQHLYYLIYGKLHMSVCGVKAWKDSDQNVNGGYLILVEFQGIFSYFLDFSSLVKFLQWFALLMNWKN